MKNIVLATAIALGLAGCSQFSNEIPPMYQSTRAYMDYSCGQLRLEAERVEKELAVYSTQQDKLANRDASLMAASLFVVTAPLALYTTGGNGPLAEEVAALRGQMVALEKVAIQKSCRI